MQLPKSNEAWYLIVFFTLTVGGLTLVLFNEIGERTDDSWVSTLEVRTKTPLVKSDWSGGTEVARINDPLCPARMALHQVVEMTAREKWEGR